MTDAAMVCVAGRDELVVTGLVGLLTERGFVARSRDSLTQGASVQGDRAALASNQISVTVLVVDATEHVAQAVTGFSSAKNPGPILVVSMRRFVPDELVACVRNGVVGLVDPNTGVAGLSEAISLVVRGHVLWSVETFLTITKGLARSSGSSSKDVVLTPREHEVLRLLAQGQSIRSLAAQLAISPKTVESLQRALYRKLGVGNKLHALQVGRTLGLLP
jgi:DNA-binding NarL/FixJ family response regulator